MKKSIIILIIAMTLFTSTHVVEGQKAVSNFDDAMGRFHLIYPSYWEVQSDNKYNVILFPPNDTKYNNTYLQIKIANLYNLSLGDHVFRTINYYISKYLVGDFIFFRIKNLESNLTIDNSPAYKLEYNVIMNDKFESPISVLEYFTAHNNQLFSLKYSEDGYATNVTNKRIINNIIQSFKF